MDTKTYPVEIAISLTPIGSPYCKITVDGQNKEVSQSLFNRRVAERAVFLTP